MFDLDRWQEIVQALGKNPFRTFLTAFGVGWGIFMLVIMLGSGNGLQNAIQGNFANVAPSSFYIWGQSTSMAHKGFQRGRSINFHNADVAAIYNAVPGVDILAPRNQLGGYGSGNNVIRKTKNGAFDVMGDIPDYIKIKPMEITSGRFINDLDLKEKRKTCVIGKAVREILFEENEEPIGEYIQIQGVSFKVVGVFSVSSEGERSDREMQTIYIPQTTFQNAFNFGDVISWLASIPKEGYRASVIEAEVINVLRERYSIHPNDARAIGHWNSEKEFLKVSGLFAGIAGVSWFVGICTLIAGVIGISNIMLVIVKERTKEIGIRRAIGAAPFSIISQIIMESMLLTIFAGIIGLALGVFLLEIIAQNVEAQQFKQPGVDLNVALVALGALIISGCIAGILPALRAVGITTVDALRTE